MQEAVAIRTPLRSTNSAKLRVLDEQHRGGDRGYEARMKALHRQLYKEASSVPCRRARMQGETASSPPLDDPFRPPVSPIPLTKATSCWSGAPAELRSAALLFQARRLACSPPSGGVLYGPACCLAQSTTRAAPDAGARKKPGVSRVRRSFGVLAALVYEAAFAFSSSGWMRLATSISHSASLSRACAVRLRFGRPWERGNFQTIASFIGSSSPTSRARRDIRRAP